jgi:hypothetical protein
VQADYSLTDESVAAEASVPRNVPLLVPVEVDAERAEAVVKTLGGLRVQLHDTGWQRNAENESTAGDQLQLSAPTGRSHVKLVVRLARSTPAQATIVERLWLQSWLGPRWRQDRAVYRLATHNHQLVLNLPTGVAASEVLVDGARVVATEGSTPEQLSIPLGDRAASDPVTVDVRYRFADAKARGWQQEVTLHQPTIAGEHWVQQSYWHVLLPREEQVWSIAAPYVREGSWSWRSWLGLEQPALSQLDMERWTHAPQETELGRGMTTYLFNSADPEATLDLRLMRRSVAVFLGSGLALLVGLSLVYLPPLRHPVVLFLCGVLLLGMASANLQAAWLVSQGTLLGVALAALALALRRVMQPRRLAARPMRSGPSSIVVRDSTRTYQQLVPAAPSSPPTTAAVAPEVAELGPQP